MAKLNVVPNRAKALWPVSWNIPNSTVARWDVILGVWRNLGTGRFNMDEHGNVAEIYILPTRKDRERIEMIASFGIDRVQCPSRHILERAVRHYEW